jgi:3-hydroxyacyl-[acyl-carrier-protein] dehydratase
VVDQVEKKTVLSLEQIKACLPHRYPLLLIDRILELEPQKRCVSLKNVTYNEEFFQGHFPNFPVMPGVLILEAMAQTSAMIFLSEPQYQEMIPLFGAIESAKFRKPVVPGDQLIMEMETLWMRNFVGKVQGRALVDNQVVATAEISCKFVSKER